MLIIDFTSILSFESKLLIFRLPPLECLSRLISGGIEGEDFQTFINLDYQDDCFFTGKVYDEH